MRLSEIDDSNRADHTRLLAEDTCLYLYEYTSGRDYTFSATNNLINNLKKKPTASRAQLGYKAGAITECARTLGAALNPKWLDIATVVPIPGSKAADHSDFDTRMEQVARQIRPGLDVRNLVIQAQSINAAHEVGVGDRVTVEELLDLYSIDETIAAPAPRAIRHSRRRPDRRHPLPGHEDQTRRALPGRADHRPVHRPPGLPAGRRRFRHPLTRIDHRHEGLRHPRPDSAGTG